MSGRSWVLVRSWHVARSGGAGVWRTLCGRLVRAEPVDELPAGKSCETCLRIAARQDDPS